MRAYAQRDRSQLERLKREHWVEQRRLHGPTSTRTAGLPGFPNARQREQDLSDHIAFKQRIDRAARPFISVR